MNQVVRAVFTIPTNMLENKLRKFGKPLGLPTLFVVEDILLVPEDDLAAKILKIMRADQSENVAPGAPDQPTRCKTHAAAPAKISICCTGILRTYGIWMANASVYIYIQMLHIYIYILIIIIVIIIILIYIYIYGY